MAINTRTTTSDPEVARLNKSNAVTFTVQVANQSVLYEINTAKYGRGENWVPVGGAILVPGLWTFTQVDWQEYGVDVVQGIRFRSAVTTDPGVVSVS